MKFSMHYVLFFSLALYACAACAYLFRVRKASMAFLYRFYRPTVYQVWRFHDRSVHSNNVFDPCSFLPWCIAFLIVTELVQA
jgi:hypothetical protein